MLGKRERERERQANEIILPCNQFFFLFPPLTTASPAKNFHDTSKIRGYIFSERACDREICVIMQGK